MQAPTGAYYHYTYDAVGNRLTASDPLSVTSYQYDIANRLTSVNNTLTGSVSYTWDNNGNLLNDGSNTYAYNSANQLTSMSGPFGSSSYSYNGMGDRINQTLNSQTTTYSLDLNAGLTQVLNDGTNTYVYGLGRIAQVNTTTEYFLGDALGSVRQLTNAQGNITLTKSYAPYGEVMTSAGSGTSPFAFTGEQQDASGLTYLRSRYYASDTGRFISRDTWMGDYNSPLSLNRWMYVEGNPINLTDPSGNVPCHMLPPEDQVNCVAASAPNTKNYDEKIPPAGITWISNGIANNINSHLAPIYDAMGNFITKTNAAQFQIAGHEKISTGNCLEWSTGNKKDRVCLRSESLNVNFCGQVMLSAILSQLLPNITAKTVADAMDYPTGTANTTLADYLNNNYSLYVTAEAISARDFTSTGSEFYNRMSGLFKNSILIAPMVNIRSGNSYPEGDPDGINGQLDVKGGINHWTLITGISTQWRKDRNDSPFNWVRIFNPFDNQAEYYWWPDFKAAWGIAGKPYHGNYTAVKIKINK